MQTGAWRDTLPDPSLPLFGAVMLGMLGIWLVIVGLLGIGRRFLDRPSTALAYLGEGSYPVYILHQTVIVLLAFYVVTLPLPWYGQWLLLLALAVAVTFALYEVVRRVDVLRFLFGMRPRRAPVQQASPQAQGPAVPGPR
jgi:peptidoglycan/LPS O-acetylase OafA/YrhL